MKALTLTHMKKESLKEKNGQCVNNALLYSLFAFLYPVVTGCKTPKFFFCFAIKSTNFDPRKIGFQENRFSNFDLENTLLISNL